MENWKACFFADLSQKGPCDRCMGSRKDCKWPTTKGKKICMQCNTAHVACTIAGVRQGHAVKRGGEKQKAEEEPEAERLPQKKRVASQEVIELDSESKAVVELQGLREDVHSGGLQMAQLLELNNNLLVQSNKIALENQEVLRRVAMAVEYMAGDWMPGARYMEEGLDEPYGGLEQGEGVVDKGKEKEKAPEHLEGPENETMQ